MSSAAASAAASGLKHLSSWKVVGGVVQKYSHASSATRTEMKFSVFLPPSVAAQQSAAGASAAAAPAPSAARVPAIYWLSGLTCTDDNFMHKAGAFRAAAEANVAIVCPDTSPRGLNLPEEKNSAITGVSWDFGEGAGFYLNATQEPFRGHYNMYDYVTRELPELIQASSMGVDGVAHRSVMGHSMGGGPGALVAFLKNPGMFRSVSAFAPICNPIECPWGQKAFSGYLGDSDKEAWKQWDATELSKRYDGPAATLLIDQGSADDFLAKKQLLPENLIQAAKGNSKLQVQYQLRDGYDHSYYFIQTFIDDHIRFHAKHLNNSK